MSSNCEITVGVPQGSILALYGDDTTLLVRSEDYKNLDTMMKRAEKEAENWFIINITNETKTCTVIFKTFSMNKNLSVYLYTDFISKNLDQGQFTQISVK